MRKMTWMVLVMAALSTTGFAQTNVTDGRAMNHVFAQLADGRFPDGTSYRSTLMVATDGYAECVWQFYGMAIPGIGTGSQLNLIVQYYDVFRQATPGTQTFKSGYSTLTCDAPVTAHVLYTYLSATGAVISEATVFSSPPSSSAQIILDVKPGSYLGIALVNNSGVPRTYTVRVFTCCPRDFPLELTVMVTVPARSQVAKFLNEWIPVLPASYFGGVVILSRDANGNGINDIHAIGLRFTGSAFTTLPVTSMAF